MTHFSSLAQQNNNNTKNITENHVKLWSTANNTENNKYLSAEVVQGGSRHLTKNIKSFVYHGLPRLRTAPLIHPNYVALYKYCINIIIIIITNFDGTEVKSGHMCQIVKNLFENMVKLIKTVTLSIMEGTNGENGWMITGDTTLWNSFPRLSILGILAKVNNLWNTSVDDVTDGGKKSRQM